MQVIKKLECVIKDWFKYTKVRPFPFRHELNMTDGFSRLTLPCPWVRKYYEQNVFRIDIPLFGEGIK